MGVYTQLVSSMIFPLHERLKGHTSVSVRRQMEQSQWWEPDRLEEFRLRRLKAFLERVKGSVPHYRSVFSEHGFEPENLVSIDALATLPLLTKDIVRHNLEMLKAENARRLAPFNTGGSSGEPLIFFIGAERVSHDVAAKWRATRWWDVDIGDPEVVVWGSPIELGAQDVIRGVRDMLLRTTLLPAFEMSDQRIQEFIAAIRNKKPKMLFGYPSAIAHIAQCARQFGEELSDLGVRVAFVTAERLYEDQRRLIGEVFGCRVANGYGGRDAGFIAHECPEGGMHITAEDIIVEIVDSDGKALPIGESGEIVVTHLATADFPFIRYRTGDIGALDTRRCPCGRGLPLLKEIEGRTTDFVTARDGTLMHGLALIYVVRDVPGVRQFKIIQESLDRTRLLLAVDANYQSSSEGVVRAGILERLGKGVEVEIDYVNSIPKETSGKFRYVVSHVRG